MGAAGSESGRMEGDALIAVDLQIEIPQFLILVLVLFVESQVTGFFLIVIVLNFVCGVVEDVDGGSLRAVHGGVGSPVGSGSNTDRVRPLLLGRHHCLRVCLVDLRLQLHLPPDVVLVQVLKPVLRRTLLLLIILIIILMVVRTTFSFCVLRYTKFWLEGQLLLQGLLSLVLLFELLPLEGVVVGVEFVVNLIFVDVSSILDAGVLGNHGFGGEGAVLDFDARLLLLPEDHVDLPPLAVVMESLEEILHVRVSAALLVNLGLKRALLLLLHLLVDAGRLYVDLFVTPRQLLYRQVSLSPFEFPLERLLRIHG